MRWRPLVAFAVAAGISLAGCGDEESKPPPTEVGGGTGAEYALVDGDATKAVESALRELPYTVEIVSTPKQREQDIVAGVATNEQGQSVRFAFQMKDRYRNVTELVPGGETPQTEEGFLKGIGSWALSGPKSDEGIEATSEMSSEIMDTMCIEATGSECPF